MDNRNVSTAKIAATIIGTIVGAGFASGQEILRFFLIYGYKGLFGLIIVTILFILFGYIIMKLGQDLKTQSQSKIIKYTCGNTLGTIIDYIITFFLFGSLAAMIAGSGAMTAQQFGIPYIFGCTFMAAVTAATVMTGLRGVINSISLVVPFLIISVLSISIVSLIMHYGNPVDLMKVSEITELKGNWAWSAVLYTSYNIVLSVAVLGALGNNAGSRSALWKGAILGGLGLGLGAAAIYFAMTHNLINIIDKEIPMIYIAGSISYVVQLMYSVILIAEIYTTAVGSLYSLSSRIVKAGKEKVNYIIIITTLGALAAGQLGFSNLVRYFYPLMGYGGILLLACIVIKNFRHRGKVRGLNKNL